MDADASLIKFRYSRTLRRLRASVADVLVVLSTTCPSLEMTHVVIKMISADVSAGEVV